ncbi:hypothetical protein V2J09_007421 [Rumex salicifolius]
MSRLGKNIVCLNTSNPLFPQLRSFSQLFVSRLSFYTTNEELKKMFSPFGEVKEARLVLNPGTQRPKGFGFVTFDSEAEAQEAMKAINGTIVRGRMIFVEPVNEKAEAGDSGCDSGSTKVVKLEWPEMKVQMENKLNGENGFATKALLCFRVMEMENARQFGVFIRSQPA